jgi:mono/diheme cytochrome c family protein
MFRRMDHMEHMGGGMMGRMHGRRGDVSSPTAYEREAILAYLRNHAMASAEGEALPAGEGRDRFRTVCARCHALPDPGQHTPDEWPAVVERMRENMRKMEVAEPSDEEAAAIVRYLQGAAARSRNDGGE